jgi:hypothetical protein
VKSYLTGSVLKAEGGDGMVVWLLRSPAEGQLLFCDVSNQHGHISSHAYATASCKTTGIIQKMLA